MTLVIGALVAGGVSCSNRESSSTDSTVATTSAPSETVAATTTAPAGSDAPTTSAAPTGNMFGTLASPCGPAGDSGAPTIADGQNGGDTLKIGVATDHGYSGNPGLTVEMLDAATAFEGWCNDQGGIRGLPVEIVDLDGKLFEVPAAMEKACSEVFAMAGGGWVFDDQMFPRFHECGMVSFPGYAVSATASTANGKVQPIPNPPDLKPSTWFQWAKDSHPDDIDNVAIIYGDFLTTKSVAEQVKATLAALGRFGEPLMIPHNPTGEANWTPFAQQLKDNDISMMTFVGEAANLSLLYKAMREIGYVPNLVLNDANFYSEQMIAEGNAESNEGSYARTAYAPFEEADQFPGLEAYLDMMDEYNPDGRIAGLGLQATSALLMFATAANTCLDVNSNVLERECILAAGKEITSWTGGGLHTETNPASGEPPKCTIIMQIQDGAWKRVFPEVGSADDNGNGWHCDDVHGVTAIEGDFGDTTSGIDPTRPN